MNDEEFSLGAARTAAERDDLRGWVARFLASDGSDNADLAEMLNSEMTCWRGPVRLPFSELHRLAGPPDQPTLARLDEDDLETVEDMEDSIDEGWEPPPLIVSAKNDQLVVEDGNHRTEGLRRAGEDSYWCIVCASSDDELDRLLQAHLG